MTTTEAPLGFAHDVEGATPSFTLRANSSGISLPVRSELPALPPLSEEGMAGGGVVLPAMAAGRSVVSWRAQESSLWLEERGLDDDLKGGGLHLGLEGDVNGRRRRGGT